MSRTGYYPAETTFNRLIQQAAARITTAMETDDIAERHNAFTDYTLALLFCATGHRPVVDPIHSKNLFDLDKGWLLISDKVVHEERSWRAVALPEIACQQMQHYLDYLPRLAAWLDQTPAYFKVRNQVLTLIDGTEQIPLFFYLDLTKSDPVQSIIPSKMIERWRDYWQLPINFLRHTTATELSLNSSQATLAQIQLGHFTGSDHPFGSTASESAQAVLSEIRTHAQAYMKKLTWEAIPSPVRLPKNATSLKVSPNNISSVEKKILGFALRQKQRRLKSGQNKDIIRAALAQATNEAKSITTTEQIQDAAKYIAVHAPVSQTNRCLKLLYRFISRTREGKKLLRNQAQLRAINVEASPFETGSITAYKNAESLRKNFLEHLNNSYGKQPPCPTRRTAEVIIAAALFGRFGNTTFLQAIPKALSAETYQYAGQLCVEIPLSENSTEAVFRWHPDDICHALIQGFFRIKKTTSTTKQTLRSMISEMLIAAGADKPANVWQYLAEVGKSLAIFEVPGHASDFLSGKLVSVSIPRPQWIRLLSGKALQTNTTLSDKQTIRPPVSVTGFTATSSPEKDSRVFMRLLRQLINQAASTPSAGNQKLSTTKKRKLEELIKEDVIPKQKLMPQLAMLLMAWAIHLCKFGTRSKKDIAFSTVDKYVCMVARALLNTMTNIDFLSLEADAYENYYLEILESQPEHRREDVAGRLYEFHCFLSQAYAVEEPAWSEIFRLSNLGRSEGFADANFIAEDEYLAIIESVKQSSFLSDRLRAQYVVLLMLGYRFGLRFGEAHRLQYRDVQEYQGEISIVVRNSIYGETKSTAGQRIVPLLETLTETETSAFTQLLAWTGVQWQTDKQAALMAEASNSRDLIERNQTIATLGQYIKLKTGDSSLRFHHLRHSWATRLYAYHYSRQSEKKHPLASKSIVTQYWTDFIGNHNTTYPLSSISTALGHLHESTTLISYVHAIDACLNFEATHQQPSAKVFAYALQISHNNSRQRIKRQTLFNLDSSIPTADIPLQERPEVINQSCLDTTKHTIQPVDIERLLIRLRETKQAVDLVADELFIDTKTAHEIIDSASLAEQTTGFEFYQVEVSHNSLLTLSENEREKIIEQLSLQTAYTLQNKNIILTLDKKIRLIESMDELDKTELKIAFKTWQCTLNKYENIINDAKSKTALASIRDKLFPELALEIKDIPSSYSGEKSLARKLSSKEVKFISTKQRNNLISSKQMLTRIFFVLSIYFDMV